MSDTKLANFRLRLEPELHAKLKAIATKNHRSLHGEILATLDRHVADDTTDDGTPAS